MGSVKRLNKIKKVKVIKRILFKKSDYKKMKYT